MQRSIFQQQTNFYALKGYLGGYMTKENLDEYTQTLLDRVVSMGRELDNLRTAYIIVDKRLNKLTSLTAKNAEELIAEASRVEDFARLAVEATKITEESARITNNLALIEAAEKSSAAAIVVHKLAADLRANRLDKIRDLGNL